MTHPAPEPVFAVARTPERITVRLTGCPRLTEENAAALGRQFAPLADGPGHVVLDLAEVEYLTSAALVELVHFCRRLRDKGGRLTVENARPLVREVLAVTGVDRLVELTAPGGDAVSAAV